MSKTPSPPVACVSVWQDPTRLAAAGGVSVPQFAGEANSRRRWHDRHSVTHSSSHPPGQAKIPCPFGGAFLQSRAEQSRRTHACLAVVPPCGEHTRTYVCVDESELLRERGCVGGMVGKVTHPGRASASLRIVQHARRVWAHFQLCRKGSIRPPICNNVRVCTYLCACVCACVHIQTALCPTSSPLSPPRPAGLAWVTTFIWPRSRPCLTPNLSRTDGQTDTYIHTCSSSSIIPPAAAPPFFSRFDPLHLASVLHTARFGHFHRALSHLVRL